MQPHDTASDADKPIPLNEAAVKLGISSAALRKRCERGTVRAVRIHSLGWLVYLDQQPGGASRAKGGTQANSSALIEQFKSEVEFLRTQLERRDMMVMHLTQRVSELSAPVDGHDRDATVTPTESRPPRKQKPFWRWLLFGEV
jgi:hypothetical protein